MSDFDLSALAGKGKLSSHEIVALMAGGRARNVYGPKLITFVESDDPAINPAEVWPVEFGTKEATTLYQGFLGAIKKAELEGIVVVKQSDGKCFLLHMEKVNAILAAQMNGDGEVETDETLDESTEVETEPELVTETA